MSSLVIGFGVRSLENSMSGDFAVEIMCIVAV
jgi:hypothetical protein